MVLLVEDNLNDAQVIRMALERSWVGESVTWLRNGVEALSYLRGDGQFADRRAFPLPRLVVVDVGLPGLSGWDVVGLVRRDARFSGLPLVVVSGSDGRAEIELAYRMGANSFILKRPDAAAFAGDMREVARYWLGVCSLPGGPKDGVGGEAGFGLAAGARVRGIELGSGTSVAQ